MGKVIMSKEVSKGNPKKEDKKVKKPCGCGSKK
jgi:hypothetical protein